MIASCSAVLAVTFTNISPHTTITTIGEYANSKCGALGQYYESLM